MKGFIVEPFRSCTQCAEQVLSKARKCKHCGSQLTPMYVSNPTANRLIDKVAQLNDKGMAADQIADKLNKEGDRRLNSDEGWTAEAISKIVSDHLSPVQLAPSHGYTNQLVDVKSRGVSILLSVFLGGLGIHKFYLEQYVWGIIYLVFCWTFIPAIIGLIEGIIFAAMKDEEFNQKFNPVLQSA